MPSLDMSKVAPLSDFSDADPDEQRELQELAKKATSYLSSFSWCSGVVEAYEGIAVAGVIGVFLFRIKPSRPDVDEWIWVVVGDVPPAYLVTDEASTPVAALEAYIEEMQAWAAAAEAGRPVDDLIPVNVAATKENAEMLKSRLQFLAERIVPEYADGV